MFIRVSRIFVRGSLGLLLLVSLAIACAPSAPTPQPTSPAQPTVPPTSQPTSPSQPTVSAFPPGADPSLVALYNDVIQKEIPGLPFSILEGAKKEGSVVWYHIALPAAHKAILEEFKKRFPFIAIEEYEAVGPQLMERFLTEQRGGSRRVDVLESTNVTLMQSAVNEGYIDTYKITSESAFLPSSYKSGVYYTYAIATQMVYIYNTNLVSEQEAAILQKWEGLWDPALRGKPIGLLNAAGNSAGQLQFYYLEKAFGRDSWQKIKDLNPRIYEPLPGGDAVARGEIAIIPNSESVALNVWLNKAPVRWTVPQPALAQSYPQAVVKNAPHPNAARLLHEFVFSKTGQELFSRYAYPGARKDVGDLRDVANESWFPKNRTYYDLDIADLAKQTPSIVDGWKALFIK